MPGVGCGFKDNMIRGTKVLLQPSFQLCVLYSHRLKHHPSFAVYSTNDTVLLVDIQCNIPSRTSCISVFTHARLSLGLKVGAWILGLRVIATDTGSLSQTRIHRATK